MALFDRRARRAPVDGAEPARRASRRSDRVRATVSRTTTGFDPALWDQMVELGWTTHPRAEEHGGAGCGYADLAVILHELGRAHHAVAVPRQRRARDRRADRSPTTRRSRRSARRARERRRPSGSVALASADGSLRPARVSTPRGRTLRGSVRLAGSSRRSCSTPTSPTSSSSCARVDRDDRPVVVAVDRGRPACGSSGCPPSTRPAGCSRVTFDDVVVAADRLLCEPGSAAPRSCSNGCSPSV